MLTITNAISKNLPSSGTKWFPIMTYIHPPDITVSKKYISTNLTFDLSSIYIKSVNLKHFHKFDI